MPFIYHDPATVTNPKTVINNITILYDGGAEGFSLAMLTCEGLAHVGVRWNVAIKEQVDDAKASGKVICDGSPSLKGMPSWFILPRELFNPELFDKDSSQFMDMVANWR
ncbi:MAG: hypothetical protein JWQ38_429 [Flavipsychrobacter sp.]|nr:hypothetical protein [Flavipsychrobacter sp.]